MKKKISVKNISKQFASRVARPFYTNEQIILRDYLALQRTTLANERTLFAYIRICLYLILGGIGLTEVETFANVKWIGNISLVLSALFLIYGISRYIILRVKLQKFYNVIREEEKKLEGIEDRNKQSSQDPKD